MGFNSGFKGLIVSFMFDFIIQIQLQQKSLKMYTTALCFRKM